MCNCTKIIGDRMLGFPTHQDCANFRNGLCTLNGIAVNPNGAACPKFTPRSITATPQAVRAHPGARRPYQPYPPQTGHSYPTPQYHHEYIYPLPHIRPAQTGYRYRTRYSSVAVPSVLTAPRQGGAGLLYMSRGRRGGGGGGRGRMGGFAAGPRGSCVCPRWGYSTPHVIGTPYYQQTCPKCGSKMTRGS
jgi:hypothetical protein